MLALILPSFSANDGAMRTLRPLCVWGINVKLTGRISLLCAGTFATTEVWKGLHWALLRQHDFYRPCCNWMVWMLKCLCSRVAHVLTFALLTLSHRDELDGETRPLATIFTVPCFVFKPWWNSTHFFGQRPDGLLLTCILFSIPDDGWLGWNITMNFTIVALRVGNTVR